MVGISCATSREAACTTLAKKVFLENVDRKKCNKQSFSGHVVISYLVNRAQHAKVMPAARRALPLCHFKGKRRAWSPMGTPRMQLIEQ